MTFYNGNNSIDTTPLFPTNNLYTNSILPRRIRAPYQPRKQTNIAWSPIIAKNVPYDLKNLFPSETFFEPKSQPGIYVLFFPSSKSVYIGESKKVNREIAEIKRPGSLANRPLLKSHFDRSGIENVKAYALLQGPEFEDRPTRLREERRFIQQAGSAAINVVGKINQNKIIRFSSNPSVIDPIFIRRTVPWKSSGVVSNLNYNIDYPILPDKPTESCLYIFVNKQTGRFYIGQSGNSKILLRIHKHRSLIRKSQFWELQGVKTAESITYEKMIQDMKNGANVFEYAIIEYLDQFTAADRIDRENNTIAEALYNYGDRVYNNVNAKVQQILSKFRVLGQTFDASKRNQSLLRYYERDAQKVAQYKIINYPVIVDGKYYDSLSEAGKILHIHRQTITNRCLSTAFPNYIYLKDPKNKIIPNSPDIKIKLQLFNKLLDAFNNRRS